MGVVRDKLRRARNGLHRRMSVPALYMPMAGSKSQALITVRVHESWRALGDLKGTNFNYAEVEEITPRIVFLLSELRPQRNAYVSVGPGEVYRIDVVLPDDDITVTAKVVKLSAAEAKGFPYPEADA